MKCHLIFYHWYHRESHQFHKLKKEKKVLCVLNWVLANNWMKLVTISKWAQIYTRFTSQCVPIWINWIELKAPKTLRIREYHLHDNEFIGKILEWLRHFLYLFRNMEYFFPFFAPNSDDSVWRNCEVHTFLLGFFFNEFPSSFYFT